MTRQKPQLLQRQDFPDHPFFDHLLRGTECYHRKNYERALEEWGAASRMRYEEPVNLKSINGRISCGSHLEEVPFLFFMYAIFVNRIDGIVVVKNREVAKKLLFVKGRLIQAGTNKREERIGKFIVQKGNFTPEKLEMFVEESKRNNKKIGQYLVENDLLSTEKLKEILALQVEEIVSDILSWDKGQFYIMQNPVKHDALVNYTPLKIAWLAARRGFNFTDFRNRIPSNKTIFRPSPYAEEHKEEILQKLNVNFQFIFSLIDGARNIDQLTKFSGADEVTVINILYHLNSMGLIRRTKEVVEYEDREYAEISRILPVLFEVYKLICDEMYNQLGARAKEIILDAVTELNTDFQKIFQDIPLQDPEKLRIKPILRNLAQHFPSPDQRTIFIDAFLGLYENLLEELKRFLGNRLTHRITERIGMKISSIERFAEESVLKHRLIDVLNSIAK